MAEILDNTMTCSFCNCKFKVQIGDVEIIKQYSTIGNEHYNVFKRIKCPICGENAMIKKIYVENLLFVGKH